MKTSSFLKGIAAWFLIFFAIDGVLSFISEVLKALGHQNGFVDTQRQFVALLVVVWALVMFAVIFLTPRLKKRFLLPPVLFALWASAGSCFPIPLFDLSWDGLLVSGAQAALGLALLAYRSLARQDLVDDAQPTFSWPNLLAGLTTAVGVVVFVAVSLAGTAAHLLDTGTAGYVTLHPTGLYLAEKTFRKGDKEVRLVGMIHIARSSFYDSVAEELRGRPAVVLLEGVSDDHGLLKKHFSYGKLAEFLGLSSQESSSFMKDAKDNLIASQEQPAESKKKRPVEYQRADLDISALAPKTLLLINALGDLLSSNSWQQTLALVRDKTSPLNDEKLVSDAMVDLIQTRNTHLMASLQGALATSNLIVVPWGAAHLGDLQKEIEKLGFQEVGSKARRAVNFSPL